MSVRGYLSVFIVFAILLVAVLNQIGLINLFEPATDNASKTMLGTDQKTWFKAEIVAAEAANQVVVWGSTTSWVAPGGTGREDTWSRYTTERTELADYIKAQGMSDAVCVIAGDMHQMAYYDPDNQTIGDYATGTGCNLPVCHAAPIDGMMLNSPSTADGPFHLLPHDSDPLVRVRQWGELIVTDTGAATVSINFLGCRFVGGSVSEEIDQTFSLTIPV